MKNGKRPTVQQRKIMNKFALDSNEWLVTKVYPDGLEIVNRDTGTMLRLDTKNNQKYVI